MSQAERGPVVEGHRGSSWEVKKCAPGSSLHSTLREIEWWLRTVKQSIVAHISLRILARVYKECGLAHGNCLASPALHPHSQLSQPCLLLAHQCPRPSPYLRQALAKALPFPVSSAVTRPLSVASPPSLPWYPCCTAPGLLPCHQLHSCPTDAGHFRCELPRS